MTEAAQLPLLTLVVFGPAAGAVLLAFIPSSSERLIRWGALAVALAVFFLSLLLWTGFNVRPGFQFVEKVPWIPILGAEYHRSEDERVGWQRSGT